MYKDLKRTWTVIAIFVWWRFRCRCPAAVVFLQGTDVLKMSNTCVLV